MGEAGKVNAVAAGKEQPLSLSVLANLMAAIVPGQSAVTPRLGVHIKADRARGIRGWRWRG